MDMQSGEGLGAGEAIVDVEDRDAGAMVPSAFRIVCAVKTAGALASTPVIGGTSFAVLMFTLNCILSVLRSCARITPPGFTTVWI